MIAVIADDFTGAAEIGGIGLRYGLKTVIATEPVRDPDVDLLIIATDTRSMSPEGASAVAGDITRALLRSNPEFIFKKLDSVLRGNVSAELIAQLEASGNQRALIVAGNPALGRVICDGTYYIDDVPLARTGFSSDPHFPAGSSSVLELVKPVSDYPSVSLKPGQAMPGKGLVIGDVSDIVALEKWAGRQDPGTLLAGASGFFSALLNSRGLKPVTGKSSSVSFGKRALFVLGSAFPKRAHFLQKWEAQGHYVTNMPEEIYADQNFDPSCFDRWAEQVAGALKQRTVFVSMIHSGSREKDIAVRLGRHMAELVRQVVRKSAPDELLIEGGSTAWRILDYLDITRLRPLQELSPGVIRMEIGNDHLNFYLTTKPGSYPWPDEVPDTGDFITNNLQKTTE